MRSEDWAATYLKQHEQSNQTTLLALAVSIRPHCCSTCPCTPSAKWPRCPLASAAILGRGLHIDTSRDLEHPIIIVILTMPLVGGNDPNSTASGDPTNLRFDRPYGASPIGLSLDWIGP
eukprot:6185815-Pleurochrysis_carterae.AAC.1